MSEPQYLGPEESFPVSLLLFDQFEDWLIGLHVPAAAVSSDVGVKLQVGSVGPTVRSATEHNRERERQPDPTEETSGFLLTELQFPFQPNTGGKGPDSTCTVPPDTPQSVLTSPQDGLPRVLRPSGSRVHRRGTGLRPPYKVMCHISVTQAVTRLS